MSQRYQWWPSFRKLGVEYDSSKWLGRLVIADLLIAFVFCLPPVRAATGIGAPAAAAIFGTHIVWAVFVAKYLYPATLRSERAFHALIIGAVLINQGACLLLPAFGGDPRTPLWMVAVVYACVCGAVQDNEPSYGFLGILSLSPLLTIPWFLSQGADPKWSIAAPILCGAISAFVYDYLAHHSALQRRIRQERDETIARLHARTQELERLQIARDLHDSVGSALSLAGLYGDLIEKHAGDPDALHQLADTLREATREGLGEMRGLLDAMAPESETALSLARALKRAGDRAALAASATISVELLEGDEKVIDGPARLAIVRCFQEGIHNAIRHGAAKRMEVELSADDAHVRMEIADDGAGFDVAALVPRRTGISGLRERVEALGGAFRIDSAPGKGSRIRVELPRVGATTLRAVRDDEPMYRKFA